MKMKLYEIIGTQRVIANTRENVGVLAENAELCGCLEMDDVPVTARIVALNDEKVQELATQAEIVGKRKYLGPVETGESEIDIGYTDPQRIPLTL